MSASSFLIRIYAQNMRIVVFKYLESLEEFCPFVEPILLNFLAPHHILLAQHLILSTTSKSRKLGVSLKT